MADEEQRSQLVEGMKTGDQQAWLSFLKLNYPGEFEDCGMVQMNSTQSTVSLGEPAALHSFTNTWEVYPRENIENQEFWGCMGTLTISGISGQSEKTMEYQDGKRKVLLNPTPERLNQLSSSRTEKNELGFGVVEIRSSTQ